MHLRRPISRQILLVLLFVGLNVLCVLGVKHGHHVTRHTRVNYSHIPSRTSRTGSRNDASHFAAAIDVVADHIAIEHSLKSSAAKLVVAPPANPTGAMAAHSATLPLPDDRSEPLLTQVNVLALGSAPRAPDLGRAPPTA
jgi:hypothetical protein